MTPALWSCALLVVVALPPVEDADPATLLRHAGQVAKTLDGLKAPLPAATVDALRGLEKGGKPGEETAAAVQKLLDPHCLVGVTINPESRVKAARGAAEAVLRQGRP